VGFADLHFAHKPILDARLGHVHHDRGENRSAGVDEPEVHLTQVRESLGALASVGRVGAPWRPADVGPLRFGVMWARVRIVVLH
jgi:hypothetical protein